MTRVRPDLSSREVEEMVEKHGSGSAAEYLRLRQEELEASRAAKREKDDEERWVEQLVGAGGNRADAPAARKTLQNEQALEVASQADDDTVNQTRLHASRSL
jgi:hypothetical protein